MKPTNARKIAIGPEVDFWLIEDEVYRAPKDAELDTDGIPLGSRWECPLTHWTQFRKIFNAVDVEENQR